MLLSMPSSQPRRRNPRGQGDRLRAALMDAARDLLLELGDQSKLSVRAVTARAGVSPNALYIHFATKDELLDAVMTASYKEWRAVLNGAVPENAEPIEQLRAYCHGYFRFAGERSGIFRVMFMTTIREGVPVPVRGGPVGEDEGVDSFNDFLAIVTRCLPDHADAFTQAAYLWSGLHGRVALGDAIPTFPWPPESEYIDRMIDLHLTNA
jgi:AcrR family transcriptional regulator